MNHPTRYQSEGYRSYMLRLWRSNQKHPTLWHASLESIPGGELLGFADINQLIEFLNALAVSGDTPNTDNAAESQAMP